MAAALYVVRPMGGFSSTHETVEAAARALLDCGGHAEPVCVVINHSTERPLSAAELRRLGQALREARERPREAVSDAGLARLTQAMTDLDDAPTAGH